MTEEEPFDMAEYPQALSVIMPERGKFDVVLPGDVMAGVGMGGAGKDFGQRYFDVLGGKGISTWSFHAGIESDIEAIIADCVETPTLEQLFAALRTLRKDGKPKYALPRDPKYTLDLERLHRDLYEEPPEEPTN